MHLWFYTCEERFHGIPDVPRQSSKGLCPLLSCFLKRKSLAHSHTHHCHIISGCIRATHSARVEWAARDGWFSCGQIFAFLSISFLLCKWF